MTLAIDPLNACSFCGKDRAEVHALIVGPMVSICDECVVVCVGLMAKQACQTCGVKAPEKAAEP